MNLKAIALASIIILVVIVIYSFTAQSWLATAVVIGFLFGFAMQKGSFCGASIISSVILYKDFKGAKAATAAILVSMAGFALMSYLGLVKLNPKSLNLLPMVIGGFVFGIGMVLSGGCISGSLYKAGEGRFNSMLALLGIGIGTNMIKKGALIDLTPALKGITSNIKIPASLYQLSGIDYIIWTIGLCLIGIILWLIKRNKAANSFQESSDLINKILYKRWSIFTSGIVIGVIACLAYLSSTACGGRDYPLGVTGGVMAVAAFITGVGVKIKWWLFLEVLAVIAGSAVSAKLSSDLKLRSADPSTLIIAFWGGILMGVGAAMAHGCFIGNILSGWALLSVGSIVAGIFIILGNWITAYLYLRGRY